MTDQEFVEAHASRIIAFARSAGARLAPFTFCLPRAAGRPRFVLFLN